MATFYQSFSSETLTPKLYTSCVEKPKDKAFKKFKKILQHSAFFHFYSILFIFLQLFLTMYLLYAHYTSPYTPASIALLFLSSCSYLLISYYQKNKKIDGLDSIATDYRRQCSFQLSSEIIQKEDQYLALSECLKNLAQSLHTQELFYLSIPPFFFSKNHIMLFFLYFHYNDIMYLQEKLLHLSIEEHKKVIENNACNLNFHSSLCKIYVAMSKLYQKPSGKHLENAFHYSNFTNLSNYLAISKKYYLLAVEEANIVCELSHNEAFAILELANIYSYFDKPLEEQIELEKLIKIIPDDKEILYKLAMLYFHLGSTGKGLKIYNKLRKLDALYAKNLLQHYSSLQNYLPD